MVLGYRNRRAVKGHVAEWLRNGLQNRVPRFNSGRGLQLSDRELAACSLEREDIARAVLAAFNGR